MAKAESMVGSICGKGGFRVWCITTLCLLLNYTVLWQDHNVWTTCWELLRDSKRSGIRPEYCWLQVRHPNHYITVPHKTFMGRTVKQYYHRSKTLRVLDHRYIKSMFPCFWLHQYWVSKPLQILALTTGKHETSLQICCPFWPLESTYSFCACT